MGGLYNGSYAAQPSNAQALLTLLDNNGNVNFTLDSTTGNGSLRADFIGDTVGNFSFVGNTIQNNLNTNINLSTNGQTLSLDTNGNVTFPGYTFPAASGNANQVLVNNGQGTLYWNTVTYSTATIDLFVGNGVQETFTLSQNPIAQNYMEVIVSGILQTPGQSYTLQNSNQVVFTSPPPIPATGVADNIQIRYFSILTAVLIPGPTGPSGLTSSTYSVNEVVGPGTVVTVGNMNFSLNTATYYVFTQTGGVWSYTSATAMVPYLSLTVGGTLPVNLITGLGQACNSQSITTATISTLPQPIVTTVFNGTSTFMNYPTSFLGMPSVGIENQSYVDISFADLAAANVWEARTLYYPNPTSTQTAVVNLNQLLNQGVSVFANLGPSGPTGPTGVQGSQGYQGPTGPYAFTTSTIAFGAYNTVTTTIAASTSTTTYVWTKIALGAEEYDTFNAFSCSAFTVPTAGYYQFNGSAGFYACLSLPNTDFDLTLSLFKNGSVFKDGTAIGGSLSPKNIYSAQVNASVYANVGDVFDLRGAYFSGETPLPVINVSTGSVSGAWLNGSLVGGFVGAQGFQGTQGAYGGPSGAQGAQGYQGTQGNQGFQSSVSGPTGVQGSQGFQGYQGAYGGPSGPQGAQGAQGSSSTNWTNVTNKNGACGPQSIAIGQCANAGSLAISLGQYAGAVKTGCATFDSNQTIAIGSSAGHFCQHEYAVAVGAGAGSQCQKLGAVGYGANSGSRCQGQYAVAVGYRAGQWFQSPNSVAIGAYAGYGCCVHSKSGIGTGTIIISANGSAFCGTTANAFYVKPVRHVSTSSLSGFSPMYYNTTTGEIVVVY
jgi:hypothetical protein